MHTIPQTHLFSLQVFKISYPITHTHASLSPACKCETNRWLTQISKGNIKFDVIKLLQGDSIQSVISLVFILQLATLAHICGKKCEADIH